MTYISRKQIWILMALVLWGVVGTALSTSSFAADEKKEAAAAPAADKAAEKPAEGGHNQSFAWWIIYNSGAIGAVLFILSIYFVATVSRLFFEFRPQVAMPPEITGQIEELLNQKDFKSIFNVVKEDDSIFSRVLATGIAELPNGLAEARDVMERQTEAVQVEMEKKISLLAVLGTLGPMIGLLGTLKGMIASFSVIAMSDTQMKASEVAGGISEALLLTFEGVALSVPAIYFFSLFRNRLMTLVTNVSIEADQFLRHFAHAARAKGPAPAAAAAANPAAKAAKT